MNLFIISGLIFLLIILNINELYEIIPEEFSGGVLVVLLIGFAKLLDNLLGNNNAILFNSDHYRVVLFMGVFLAILTIILNMIFIPIYDLHGAAFATFIAMLLYNFSKIAYVKYKFGMLPFTNDTLKSFILILVLAGAFYFWDFPFHPIINIGLKSILITGIYVLVVFKYNLSEDITSILKKFFNL